MPDVLVLGATRHIGDLVTRALAKRAANFIVASGNRGKLEALATATGASGVAVVRAGDVPALAEAARDVRVLLTCVSPFTTLGRTAADAALRARVHYIDCCGESAFVADLIARYDSAARSRGIAMAPAMGFDEVPADVAATIATEGFDEADLVLTYALPSPASWGTIRSAGAVSSPGQWIAAGSPRPIRAGEERRWAPMPPPLGPLASVSFPLAEGYLAPLHLRVRSLKLFLVASLLQRAGLRMGHRLVGARAVQTAFDKALAWPEGGTDAAHRRQQEWMILAEATCGGKRRNVALSGRDACGLTAELLAAGALKMAESGYPARGVVAPVQTAGIDVWREQLVQHGVRIQVFESR
ncbi:MAG: saccharopine dehydrogenase NADP-binding domain-containing protein [Actinomycetota bacterium]|nr:saccharopine dehydrogenase NADP-binding domain-containing protein [Actinomycetota bacterium]